MKTILITGGSSGIGKATCELFAKDYKVISLSRTKVSFNNENIIEYKCDLSNIKNIDKLVLYIQKENIEINFIVNNAATIDPIERLENISEEQFQYALDLNVKAPFFLIQKLIPFMKNNDTRILNISSEAAHYPIERWDIYCITKAALLMMSKCIQNSLKEKNILIGTLIPGGVDTKMQEYIRSKDEISLPNVQKFIDLKNNNELRQPEIIAKHIKYLLEKSDEKVFLSLEQKTSEYIDII
jgi:benzil reductase ((S)-benzoin forming)